MIINSFLENFTSKKKVSINETLKLLFSRFKKVYLRILFFFLIVDVGLYFSFYLSDYNFELITELLLILLMDFASFIGAFVSFKKSLEYPLKDSFKSEIDNWLEINTKFNHSSQYFHFANSLRKEQHNYEPKLNLGWVGSILLSFWTVIITLILQDNPDHLFPMIVITLLLAGMIIFLNKAFKLMYNEFFTSKKYRYDKYIKAIRLVEELGIQKSIEEHENSTNIYRMKDI